MTVLRVATVLLAAALAGSAAVSQDGPAQQQSEPIAPPPAKGEAIFPGVNTITITGPAIAGGSITWEGLPPGTTKWITGNPLSGGVKGLPASGTPAAAVDPKLEQRLAAVEAQQAQILQVVLDLQKQLKATKP